MKEKLSELGYEMGDNAFEVLFHRFKELADRKKHIYDEDIQALADSGITQHNERIKLISMSAVAGTSGPQTAKVTLEIDGSEFTSEESGDGPVDAMFNAVKSITSHSGKLTSYQVSAVTGGTDAQAEVAVHLEDNGKISVGKAADTNTLVASAHAYITAVNRLVYRDKKIDPYEFQEPEKLQQAQ